MFDVNVLGDNMSGNVLENVPIFCRQCTADVIWRPLNDEFQATSRRARSAFCRTTRRLSPVGAVAIIVGIVIGAGIFKTPSMVAGVTGDAGWMIVAWILGGVISLAGALCYAELATTYPHAGGDYHFLGRAFGRQVSFLYAWAKATVINTGSIALLAFVLAITCPRSLIWARIRAPFGLSALSWH